MKNYKSAITGAWVLLTLSVFSPGAVHAALVTVENDNLVFQYDDATLWGAGTLVGNSLLFSPLNFKAESTNGEGLVTENGLNTVVIDVWVKAGSNFLIDGASLYEEGDYQLIGDNSWVDVTGELRVRSLTDLSLSAIDTIETSNPLTTKNQLTDWDANANVDFDDVAGWGTDTHVRVTLENLLRASTHEEDPSLAFVQKKDGIIGLEIMPEVPLPGTVWLFGSALLGLAGFRHQKNK